MKNFNLPCLGAGLALRERYVNDLIAQPRLCNWLEVTPEHFINHLPSWTSSLELLREKYTFIGHCISLSVGSTDQFDKDKLSKIKKFLDTFEIPWVSDHLCFTSAGGHDLEDLIPLPFTHEAVENVATRVRSLQDYFERPFLLENITHYFNLPSEFSEADFINRILLEANCGLLLDISNVILRDSLWTLAEGKLSDFTINHAMASKVSFKLISNHRKLLGDS